MTRFTNLCEFSTNNLTPQGFEQITRHFLRHNVPKYQGYHSPPKSDFEVSTAIDCIKFSQFWVIVFDPSKSQHASSIELIKRLRIQKSITTIKRFKNYYRTGIDSKLFNQISNDSKFINSNPVSFSVLIFDWFKIISSLNDFRLFDECPKLFKQLISSFTIERYQDHWHVLNFN